MIQDKLKTRISDFWAIQTTGWLTYAVLFYFFFHWHTIHTLNDFLGFFITIGSGFGLSLVLRFYYRKIDYKILPISKLSLVVCISSILVASLWYWLDALLSIFVYGFGEITYYLAMKNILFYLNSFFYYSILIFTWSVLYFLLKLWFDWQNQKTITDKASHDAECAQMKMLRYQLNPHFLFNSLNSIRSLIDENAVNAKSMITDLSEFLRFSLLSKDTIYNPFRKEIEAARYYTSIEKKRYGDKLDVLFSIDPEAEDFIVPCFLIHPLVENAVKYGMLTSSLPLKIQIIGKINHDSLIIEVHNSGKWIIPTRENRNGTGTGLENVIERLKNFSDHFVPLRITQGNGWVKVAVQVKKNLIMQDEKIF